MLLNRRTQVIIGTIVLSIPVFLIFQNFSSTSILCSKEKLNEILEPASSNKSFVEINCSTTLPKNKIITKRILFRGSSASNINFNCNGSVIKPNLFSDGKNLIEISSKRTVNNDKEYWDRPENVLIQNCRVIGSIRIIGMSRNGEGKEIKESSLQLGHTERAQAAAPKNITLKNMHITGTGIIPLYFSPGVTHSSLLDSKVDGESDSVAIYFDAESAHNKLQNNYIHTKTLSKTNKKKIFGLTVYKSKKTRELIAVDGSANNLISGNRLSSLNNGGIYIYRNCGEGGTIRHQIPVRNQIINNIFYYNKYKGGNPAIWISSRNGGREYCDADKGYPFGSSQDDRDLAKDTIIAQNQFFKFEPSQMIRASSGPNLILFNERIDSPISRKSSCFLKAAYPSELVLHGQKTQHFLVDGQIVCNNFMYTCNDGVIAKESIKCDQKLAVQTKSFQCKSSGSNQGCTESISCEAGQRIIGIKAACNLESGSVSPSIVNSATVNQLVVARASDKISDGHCEVNDVAISSGSADLKNQIGKDSVFFSCREKDKNGGDCHIAGQILCR